MLNFLKNIFSNKKLVTKFPNVVVGQITAITNHPNADRLKLTTVNIGQNLEVVCGANNIEIGQFVPVALVGATLPNGMVIQQATIRGVDSSGMLCAADELGIGIDHSGIMILNNAKIGDPIDKYI